MDALPLWATSLTFLAAAAAVWVAGIFLSNQTDVAPIAVRACRPFSPPTTSTWLATPRRWLPPEESPARAGDPRPAGVTTAIAEFS
jgi:hypothetical protein